MEKEYDFFNGAGWEKVTAAQLPNVELEGLKDVIKSARWITCKNCGKTFTGLRQKYCSDQCRAMARKKHVAENNQIYRMKHKNSQSKEKKNED